MAKLWVNWVFNIFKADSVACLCSAQCFVGLTRFNKSFHGSRKVNAFKLTVIELSAYLSGFYSKEREKKSSYYVMF